MLSKLQTNNTESFVALEKDFIGLKSKKSLPNDIRDHKYPNSSSFDNNELFTKKIVKRTNKGRKENFSLPTDKIKCEICLEYSDFSKEEIVSCSSCQGHFHKSCYDQYEIFNSSSPNLNPIYKCFRCIQAEKLNKNINDKDFNCFICGHSNKILNYNSLHRIYYHMICLLFISELCNLPKEEISREKLRRWRFKNSCKYCGEKLSKSVAVIKCKKPKCKDYYHIPCAIEKGMIFSLNFMRQYYNLSKGEQIPFYCSNHNKKIVNQYKNYIMNEQANKEIKEKTNDKNEEKAFLNFYVPENNDNSWEPENIQDFYKSFDSLGLCEDEDKIEDEKMQESEESKNSEDNIEEEEEKVKGEKNINMDIDDEHNNNDVFKINFINDPKDTNCDMNEGDGYFGLNRQKNIETFNNIDEFCLNKNSDFFLNRQNSNFFVN